MYNTGMVLQIIDDIFQNQPAFKKRVALEWIFKHGIDDWSKATSLSKDVRLQLQEKCPLNIPHTLFESNDTQTVKSLITLHDGHTIESVLMRYKDGRNSVCVSTQVGCAMGCKFCATGKLGFSRNLSIWEIVMQVLLFQQLLVSGRIRSSSSQNQRIDNVVFMGMGEPFLNYENVLSSIKVLNDQKYFGIGARKISISTSGIIPGIQKLSDEDIQVNLAISLHAADNSLRSKLIPINKKYPLEDLLQSIKVYIKKTNRKVMFEYIMIKGVNDSEDHALELVQLLKRLPVHLYMVNLIPYNSTGLFQPSSEDRINFFQKLLMDAGIQAIRRKSFGGDIRAACGQLVGEKTE